ncbi:MAG: GMC family oxidoreductase, partial [Burkholderiales bacterium]|nr:GMC family oxidoreductase [Burkholderiales bacterium]
MSDPGQPEAAMDDASRRPRPALSRSLSSLWSEGAAPAWDVVVVGSGYGGSVAAAVLAGSTIAEPGGGRRPLRLAVLERGREYLPGDFPSRLSDLPAHWRIARQDTGAVSGNTEGLFDLRLGADVAALLANGLGGGSLINAGVLLEPRPNGLEGADWLELLAALGGSGDAKNEDSPMRRALRALGGEVAAPDGARVANTIARHAGARAGSLPKLDALRAVAGSDFNCRPVPLIVAMADEANSAGVALPACTLCGDCMTGCNVGAKNSHDANLLALAAAAGAEIVTGASVLRLAREGGAWRIEVQHSDARLREREPGPLVLRAGRVILAAGTLGSSEILLRSRSDRLALSPTLGARFSCNGDNIVALRGLARPTRSCADETTPLEGRGIGPTITGAIEFPNDPDQGPGFLVQDFAVPGPMKWLFDETVTTAGHFNELARADCSEHRSANPGALDPFAVDPEAMARSLLVGVFGHDEARGCLGLAPAEGPRAGGVQIRWPEARDSRWLDQAQQRLQALAGARGASLVPNPLWRLLPPALETLARQPRGPVLTVHPLGGCAIGRDAGEGVVDGFGRVYDAWACAFGEAAAASCVGACSQARDPASAQARADASA